jgi:CBS domain containing-hemolysin-like protein
VILVVSEIIPKTLGAVYASRISGFVGWTLHAMTRALTPVLLLSRAVTRLLTRRKPDAFSRGELAAIISVATRDGAISSSESRLFENLLRFRGVRVVDVMTPRTVVFMLPVETTVAEMLAASDAAVFSRIPLYRDERDNVVGYVLQRDVLQAVARDCDRSTPLERYMRPIHFVPELASVDSALHQILRRREPLAMVTDEHGGVEGLVTLEDLTETILGAEIVDESDRVVDMRKAALRMRDERLERTQQKRASRVDGNPDAVEE